MVREHQVVVALIAVGLLRAGIDLDHAAPHGARVVLQRRLVEQVALAAGGLVMLQRVVRQVLLAFGEHHAVDLGVGAAADQRHVLIHLGQPAAQGGDRPLQRGVARRPAPSDGRSATRRCPSSAGSRTAASRRAPTAARPRRSAGPAAPSPRLAVSASSVASAPSSRITSAWPRSLRRRDRAESMCSGSSIATPRGTYSSVPPDQAAACRAANLS